MPAWEHKISDFDITGTDVGFRASSTSSAGPKALGFRRPTPVKTLEAQGCWLAPGVDLGWIRQYFQAAVFEYHPAEPEGSRVKLSLLGDTLRNQNYPNDSWVGLTPFQAAAEVAEDSAFTVLAVNR